MILPVRSMFALIALVTILPGCGEESSPTDAGGNGGPNDGTVVLLDARTPTDWTCAAGSRDCRYCIVAEGVISERDTTVVFPGPPAECRSLNGRCEFRSTRRIDFRPYASARLQCRIRRVSYPTTTRVDIHLLSNVPGTPDLLVFSAGPELPQEDLVLDISLENARGMGEATLALSLLGYAQSGSVQSGCRDGSAVEVHDFRIVATRP